MTHIKTHTKKDTAYYFINSYQVRRVVDQLLYTIHIHDREEAVRLIQYLEYLMEVLPDVGYGTAVDADDAIDNAIAFFGVTEF